ncbi:hypothetical protein LINGRAHAP2_LOCUS31129 [Linum grandiflorum]
MGRYLDYDEKNDIEYPNVYMHIRVLLYVRTPLQKERLVKLHRGNKVNCLFRYERLQTFCFICGIMGHKEQQCELRYRFPEDQLPFLWDDSIKAVSRSRTRVRDNEQYYSPTVPDNVRALAICMGANAWDKDKHIAHPQLSVQETVTLIPDEKKRRRTEREDI